MIDLEIVLTGTDALAVQDHERAALVAALQPIAERIPGYLSYAAAVIVENAEQAVSAASYRDTMLADAVNAETTLREFDNRLIERLFKTHRAWTALIGRFGVLEDAAKKVKQTIIGWQVAEAAKAERERQRLQAEAEERARRERERLEKEAARLKTPELREQRLEQAAAVIAPVVQVAAPANAVRTQKRWVVQSLELAAFGIPATVAGYFSVEKHPDGRFKLAIVSGVKLAAAKTANSELHVPGVTFQQITI